MPTLRWPRLARWCDRFRVRGTYYILMVSLKWIGPELSPVYVSVVITGVAAVAAAFAWAISSDAARGNNQDHTGVLDGNIGSNLPVTSLADADRQRQDLSENCHHRSRGSEGDTFRNT